MGRLCTSWSAMLRASWQPPKQRHCVWAWWRVRWRTRHPLGMPRWHSNCPLVLLLKNTMLLAQADRDRQALDFAQLLCSERAGSLHCRGAARRHGGARGAAPCMALTHDNISSLIVSSYPHRLTGMGRRWSLRSAMLQAIWRRAMQRRCVQTWRPVR